MNSANSTSPGPAIGNYMDTAPFWEATKQGRLLIQFCPGSGRYQAYPRPGSVLPEAAGLNGGKPADKAFWLAGRSTA